MVGRKQNSDVFPQSSDSFHFHKPQSVIRLVRSAEELVHNFLKKKLVVECFSPRNITI